jgi:hypothetical protein
VRCCVGSRSTRTQAKIRRAICREISCDCETRSWRFGRAKGQMGAPNRTCEFCRVHEGTSLALRPRHQRAPAGTTWRWRGPAAGSAVRAPRRPGDLRPGRALQETHPGVPAKRVHRKLLWPSGPSALHYVAPRIPGRGPHARGIDATGASPRPD